MKTCPTCGPTEVEVDDRMGHSVCIQCGNVLELNTIVSEVTFTETSKGGSMADGFSVSAGSARAKSSLPGKYGLIRTGTAEPREQTIANGHKKIQEVASQAGIRMPERHIQAAQRFFNLAVINSFTKGRKAHAVVAACLYIVCRMEKTAHMLIDFADALSVNVFTLGATFLKLVHLLSIKLPIVDPALYISRFADKLDYGTKTNDIVKDANRLASRMNRDWLQTGRRPAGICAAALFVASRIHGFSRTHKEIVLVVKICENTLRKRLLEFSSTPSGDLTVTEFQTLWLEDERDPPAFTRGRDKKAQTAVVEKETELLKKEESEMESDEETDFDNDETLQDMMEILEREEIRDLEANFRKIKYSKTLVPTPPQEESLSDLDDDLEVQNMLAVSSTELEFKTLLWTDANKDWLEAQKVKAKKEQPNTKDKSLRQVKKKQKKQNQPFTGASSAAEAARNLIQSKPSLSKKINYKVLDNLFDSPVTNSSVPVGDGYSADSVTGFGRYSL